MECILAFVVLLFVLCVTGTVTTSTHWRHQRRNEGFRQLARRFGGTFTSGWFSHPRVRFRYGQTHVVINSISAGGRRDNQTILIQFDWPDYRFACEIYPDFLVAPESPFRQMDETMIGDDRFDRDYKIHTNDAIEVRTCWHTAFGFTSRSCGNSLAMTTSTLLSTPDACW